MQEGGGGGWLNSCAKPGASQQIQLSGMESRVCYKPLAIKGLPTNSAQAADLKEECTGGVRTGKWPRARAYCDAFIMSSIFQILAKHRLRWIEAAIDNAHQQLFVGVLCLGQCGVAAFPLERPACRVDEREIAARGILQFEQLIGHVRIAR